MYECKKKRKADRDHHAVKVYKKQKTKRNLSASYGHTRTWCSK